MSKPRVVRLILHNSSTLTKGMSLEPFGDYCELRPGATVHATWELPAEADLELELAITNDSLVVWDASKPMAELSPSREDQGGDLWQ